MLAVVRMGPDARDLVFTLSSLVRGVVEGDLRSVVVAARPGDVDAVRIAEESGATLIERTSWREALAAAGDRAGDGPMLIIDSGVTLGEAFWPEVQEALAHGLTGPLVTCTRGGLLRDLARRLSGRISPDQAVVARAGDLKGDPWRDGVRHRPRSMQAASFRPARRGG